MRKLLAIGLFIALFGVADNATAQGTLQFNKVIVVTLDGSNPFAFTVPANKVWKIESAGSGYYSSTIYLREPSGDRLAYIYTNSVNDQVRFPYWLPSGFSGDFYRIGNIASGPKSTVSIIEFNVIP